MVRKVYVEHCSDTMMFKRVEKSFFAPRTVVVCGFHALNCIFTVKGHMSYRLETLVKVFDEVKL